jgi:Uma2 family endonuclease
VSSTALVSEAEYLVTVYEPDREYSDGEVIERNMGEQDHSWLQSALTAYFFRRRRKWSIEVYTEQRVRIGPGRYMIPDICVIPAPRPPEKIFTTPPLLWIEILSPEDRPIRVNEKIRQLLDFGVRAIWVIDPETLEAEIHTPAQSRSVDDAVLRVEGTPIEVPLRGLEED